jgi:rsbT co-antagonist protein RsbR
MGTAREDLLVARVEALEAELAERKRAEEQLRELEQRLRSVIEVSRDAIGITERGVIVETNERAQELFLYDAKEIIGLSALALHPPEWRDFVKERVLSGHAEPYEAVCVRKDGSTFAAEIYGRAIAVSGRPARVTAIRDISTRREIEEAQRAAAVREEVIRAQAALLAELSSPVLPIGRGVLVLPLIGRVTEERAARVLEVLSEEVSRRRARVAILDITGMLEVDAEVGDALLRAARTARLLGAEVILAGVRSHVARSFVDLGAGLEDLATCRTLEQGIARALRLISKVTPRRGR